MDFLLILLILFFALCILFIFLIMPRLKKTDFTALSGFYYAHRGLHSDLPSVPENSLAAFAHALECGYGMELDVQLTADEQVVVFHDETLKRICGIDEPLHHFTYAQLQEFSLSGTQERIPLFSEVLKLVQGKTPLIVEIKYHYKTNLLCEKTAALLDTYSGAYCIESFHPLAVFWFKRNRPNVIRGQLAENYLKSKTLPTLPGFFAGNLLLNFLARPDFIAYRFEDRNAFAIKICCTLFRAQRVYWTIRSEQTLETTVSEGALGIFEHFLPNPTK